MRYAIQVQAQELNYYAKLFSKSKDNNILLAMYCDETNECIWKLISNKQLENLKKEKIVLSFSKDENFLFAGRKENEEFLSNFPLVKSKTI